MSLPGRRPIWIWMPAQRWRRRRRKYTIISCGIAAVCLCTIKLLANMLTLPVDTSASNDTKLRQSHSFNSSCSQDVLGLPERVAQQCLDPTEPCGTLTCRRLLVRDSHDSVFDVARYFMKTHVFSPISDAALVTLANDCDTFRRQRSYLVDDADMSDVEREAADFPIAFNLIVHQDADQVARILRSLYRPQNQFCIHVDPGSSSDFQAAIHAVSTCFENVFIATRNEPITWAGYNRLQAEINCMNDQVAGPIQWRYLINSAGQAFPLRTIGEMVRILRIYNGSNDIEGIYGDRILRYRFENEWIETPAKRTLRQTWWKRNEKPPHNIDIVRGSAYGIFSRAFVEWTLENKMAMDLLKWSRTTWSPDEFYWATLHHTYSNPHMHSPGGFSGYPSDKPWLAVFANWGETPCYGRWRRNVCIFGVGDLPQLVMHKEFFVNKFHADFEPLSLECLDAWVRYKEQCPVFMDYDYYRKLPFIKENA